MTQMRKVTTSTPEFRFNANRIHKYMPPIPSI